MNAVNFPARRSQFGACGNSRKAATCWLSEILQPGCSELRKCTKKKKKDFITDSINCFLNVNRKSSSYPFFSRFHIDILNKVYFLYIYTIWVILKRNLKHKVGHGVM